MSFITELQQEIVIMDIPNFIIVALMFYVPFHFSKKADSLFLHLLYSFFGVYLLLTMDDPRIIYDMKMLVGLGLLIPQISFLKYFIPESMRTIKMMSANTYFFFISIYYKILRFLNWLDSIFIFLKTFFNRNTDSSYKENKQEYSYEEKTNNSYNQEEKQEQYYEEEVKKEEAKEEYGEYERFYSDSAYIVLGVSTNDDFSTIKKSYRMLIRIYHPDLNPDNIKLFTEITQNINSAYEKLEEIHK